jgi:hypothetical protein
VSFESFGEKTVEGKILAGTFWAENDPENDDEQEDGCCLWGLSRRHDAWCLACEGSSHLEDVIGCDVFSETPEMMDSRGMGMQAYESLLYVGWRMRLVDEMT